MAPEESGQVGSAATPPERERLTRLRETYAEVLAATKHEDEKVGRFLTAMAFLVAGALLFSQQRRLLEAAYDLGAPLKLPAITLGLFITFITFAVLLYLLAIAAPVTPPPGRSDSLLFFNQITKETPNSWRAKWSRDYPTIHQQLEDNYIDETWNIAYRVYTKRHISTGASAIFAVALLFFVLTIGLSIHVLSRPPQGAGGEIEWSWQLRVAIAVWLSVFCVATLYQRGVSRTVRRAEAKDHKRLGGFEYAIIGLTILIVTLTVISGQVLGIETTVLSIGLIVVGATMTGIGWYHTEGGLKETQYSEDAGDEASKSGPGKVSRLRLAVSMAALLLVLAMLASTFIAIAGMSLLLAVVTASTPLAWALIREINKPWQLRDVRRARA